MSASRQLRFILRFAGEPKLVETFETRLAGRVFDFEYRLPDMGEPILIQNQKLCSDGHEPIKIEHREINGVWRECLTFIVEDPDDLFIPVSSKRFLDIDLCDEQKGIIKITNDDDEKYRFIVHKGKIS